MRIPLLDSLVSDQEFRSNIFLVGALGVFCAIPYLLTGLTYDPHIRYAVFTGEIMVLGLLFRRARANLMLTLVTLGGLGQLLLGYPTFFLVTVPVAVYSYARWAASGRVVLIIGGLTSILGPTSWGGIIRGILDEPTRTTGAVVGWWVMLVLLCLGLVVTPYAFARRVREADLNRQQQELAEQQRIAAELTEREQAARMAEMRTRNQIARELHDIVAHSLSVMIVQAEGGRAVTAKHPERAGEVLGTVADIGREALGEMRRLVGVLRGGPGEEPEYTPSPDLGDLQSMVDRAGDRVRLQIDGELPPSLSKSLQLIVYRIAQEGVTNSLKHAGDQATCLVRLQASPMLLVLDVADDGRGADAVDDGKGHGLAGMQERLATMGGTVTAGPRAGGGFLVHAEVPLQSGAFAGTEEPTKRLVRQRNDGPLVEVTQHQQRRTPPPPALPPLG